MFSPYRAVNTSVSVIQTSQLMLCREIIAVCSQIHTKHINTQCGQNVELVNVKPGGTYSDHCAVHIVTAGLQTVKGLYHIQRKFLVAVYSDWQACSCSALYNDVSSNVVFNCVKLDLMVMKVALHVICQSSLHCPVPAKPLCWRRVDSHMNHEVTECHEVAWREA